MNGPQCGDAMMIIISNQFDYSRHCFLQSHITLSDMMYFMKRAEKRSQALASLTKTQRERLSHIDFKLYFFGELRRADVVDRFGTGPAGATRVSSRTRAT